MIRRTMVNDGDYTIKLMYDGVLSLMQQLIETQNKLKLYVMMN